MIKFKSLNQSKQFIKILKKNLQQQKGIELCNNYNRILKELNSTNELYENKVERFLELEELMESF